MDRSKYGLQSGWQPADKVPDVRPIASCMHVSLDDDAEWRDAVQARSLNFECVAYILLVTSLLCQHSRILNVVYTAIKLYLSCSFT